MKHLLSVLFLIYSCAISYGQTQLKLVDMSEFQPHAGNWQVVGNVEMSRDISLSHEAPSSTAKKKKKSKSAPIEAVSITDGTGILINLSNQPSNGNLISNFEHGDIFIEFDVMLPKGSNSGFYLQGRYEIQLFDSWGVQNPKFSDMGGIYRNWEKAPEKRLYGIPPLSNACKAPGLWQHMKVKFKAPRFDESGNKTSNAILELVELNGVVIHRNIELVLPTGGPIEKNEVTKGPIMIQGDHGQVAFKNIKYTLLEPSMVSISEVTFKQYEGDFKTLDQVPLEQVDKTKSSKLIDMSLCDLDDKYAVLFEGNLNIPIDDTYDFSVGFSGGYRLSIDGVMVAESNSPSWASITSSQKELKKGSHKFQLLNIKSAGWHAPRLGLFVQTPSTSRKALHTISSYPETVGINSKIKLNPTSTPRMLRAFVHFKDDTPKLSHTIGVGHPAGLNYIVNLQTGGIIGTWRGEFVDATPMWNNRGNGSFNPEGAVIWTFTDQPIAKLETRNSPFPTYENYSINQKGYSINPSTDLPVFNFQLNNVDVSSKIESDPDDKYWIHSLTLKGDELAGLYYKLAEGKIEKMKDGSYAINDRHYYIKMLTEQKPFERTINGQKELVLPLNGLDVKYEIAW